MAKFARMGGYKSKSVASTTWCRVRRHLQKVAPVKDPNPTADTDDKKRKRDEDGDKEERVPVKKRGKVAKAVGSDDELASEGAKVGASANGKGGKGRRGAVGKGLTTPDGDPQEETRNCITVKGGDGEDGLAEGKKNPAKKSVSKARSAVVGKSRKGIAASDKAVGNGVGGGGGGSGMDSGTKKGNPEKEGSDASASKVDEAEDSDTVDEDAIVAKEEKEVHAKEVDEPHDDAGPIEGAPAGEGSKSKGTKAGGVDTEKVKGVASGDSDASAGQLKGASETDSGCIEAAPTEEASNPKNSKPTKATKGSGAGSKKFKGKLSTDSVLVEADSVKKSGRVKNTKTTTAKGNAKPKKETKSADYTEAALVLDIKKAVVSNDKDAGLAKDGKVGAAEADGGAPVKRSRQAKPSKDGSTSASGAGNAGVEKMHTAKEDNTLRVEYTADDTQGAGVIPDSQDSENA